MELRRLVNGEKILYFFLFLCITITSCSGSTDKSKITQSPCYDNWNIVPVELFTVPSNNEGWSYILIRLAVENSGQYWGSVDFRKMSAFIKTEEGFTYKPIDYLHADEFATKVKPFDEFMFTNVPNTTPLLPPNIVYSGGLNGSFSSDNYIQYIFEIAATQHSYQLNLVHGIVECAQGDINYSYTTTWSIKIINDAISTKRPNANFDYLTALNSSNISTDIGTFTFTRIEKYVGQSDEMVKYALIYQFVNASAGYDSNASINGYTILKEGIICSSINPCDDSSTTVGPGMTKELKICFSYPEGESQIALVFLSPFKAIYKLASVP